MKVTINNKQHVDNQLKPRGSWGDVAIQEGASITIIKAACGG